jgi:hypothetical protein
MNQDAAFLPRRGNGFSLSPRERAGVRVSVKLIIPRASTRIEMHYPPFDSVGSWDHSTDDLSLFLFKTALNTRAGAVTNPSKLNRNSADMA